MDISAIENVGARSRVATISTLGVGTATGGTGGAARFDTASIVTLSPLSQLLAASAASQTEQEAQAQLPALTSAEQYLFAPQFGLLNRPFGQKAYAAVQSFIADDTLTNMFESAPTTTQATATTNAATTQEQAKTNTVSTNLATELAPNNPVSINEPATAATVITTATAERANPVAASSTTLNVNPPVFATNPLTMTIDPLVLTAVASYRLGEAVANNRSELRFTTPEYSEDQTTAVYRPDPVALDLQQDDAGR